MAYASSYGYEGDEYDDDVRSQCGVLVVHA